MADFQEVAKAFVEFYYKTFDANRQELLPLYVRIFLLDNLAKYLDIDACHPRSQREQSLLTFEGSQFMGAANIVEKLTVSWIFLRAWIQERFF